jgi:hypothetical protein
MAHNKRGVQQRKCEESNERDRVKREMRVYFVCVFNVLVRSVCVCVCEGEEKGRFT